MSRKSWQVRACSDAIDARQEGVRDELHMLQIRLAGYAGRRAYCYPGNAELAGMSGCSTRAIQNRLAELETLGKIARVMTGRNPDRRMAIILLDRPDRDSNPCCRTAEDLERIKAEVLSHWRYSTRSKLDVTPQVMGDFARSLPSAKSEDSKTPEIPRENRDLGRTEIRHRSEASCVTVTNVRSPELVFIEPDSSKQQQGKPLPPDSMDSQTVELSTDGAEAVARVRAEASASKPTDAVPLAAAVGRMARAGHNPGRLEAIARESLRKDRPVPYFLAAVTNRAAEEDPQTRLLRGVPKPPPKPKGQTVELTAEDIAFFASAKSGCGVGRKAGGGAR